MKQSNASNTPRVFRLKRVDGLRQGHVVIKIDTPCFLCSDAKSVATVESLLFLLLHSFMSLESLGSDIRPPILDLPSS